MSQIQFQASDPTKSSWVSASAGSGKTKVLVDRLVRLLLLGEDFRSIVGFTYTQAAAVEMKERLQKCLEGFANSSLPELKEALTQLLQRSPTSAEISRAQTLLDDYRAQHRGLRIQTLHSFCKDFLEAFALVSETYEPLSVLEETASIQWLHEVQEESLLDPQTPSVLENLQKLLKTFSFDQIEELLQAFLAKRHDFASFLKHLDVEQMRVFLRQQMATDSPKEPFDALETQRLAVLLLAHPAAGASEKKLLQEAAQGRFFEAFFTQGQIPRKKIFSVGLSKRAPEACAAFLVQKERFTAELTWQRTEDWVDQSLSLIQMADSIFQRYQDRKERYNVCDFDDLVMKTQKLLENLSDDASLRSACRLAFPVKHVFLDEAQDTSLPQWKILMQMVRVFFTDATCTIFVVGDIKQSIYSFQGAKPWLFQTFPDVFKEFIERCGGEFQRIYLQTSYRTAPAILRVVDRLFEQDPCGITFDEPYRPHSSARKAEGFVKSLAVRPRMAEDGRAAVEATGEPEDAIQPATEAKDVVEAAGKAGAEEVEPSNLELLAETLAEEIQSILDQGVFLPSIGRAAKAEDILVLARKRGDLWPLVHQKLAARGIPAAASDRLHLSRSLVWQDLQVFVQFLVDPYDDYNLACLLKGPFLKSLRFSEESLFELCYERKASLWTKIQSNEVYEDVKTLLNSYVHESKRIQSRDLFYQYFYRLLKWVQPVFSAEASETPAIFEGFLKILEGFLQQKGPSLVGFQQFLQANEKGAVAAGDSSGEAGVRFLTVHGAKGLQAPLVILADPSEPLTLQKEKWVCMEGVDHQTLEGVALMPPATLTVEGAQRLREHALQNLVEENRRLLYVALTRAQDGLISVGLQKPQSWSGLVFQAISDEGSLEGEMLFTSEPSTELASTSSTAPSSEPSTDPASTCSASDPLKPLGPLPSKLKKLQENSQNEAETEEKQDKAWEKTTSADEGAFPSQVRLVPGVPPQDFSALEGIWVHQFIQALAEETFDEAVALRWFEQRAPWKVVEALRKDPGFVKTLVGLPRHPEFTYIKFGRPEVTLFNQGVVMRADHVFVDDQKVVVTEVKTSRSSDSEARYTPQLAAYKQLLGQIFPQHTIQAYFLWARQGEWTCLKNPGEEESHA